MQGKLEDFSPGELIQILGLFGKSGALRLSHADREGLVVFRTGKVIYAASPSVRESLGSLLLARKLISETQLTEALERQAGDPQKRRLGGVLVEMEILTQTKLEELIREQFSTIISEFIHWSSGSFSFEYLELVDRGEVELEAADFLVSAGIESTHVLLDAARRADEMRRVGGDQPVSQGEEDSDSLDTLLDEVTSPTIRGETVYRLLDLGGDTCGRCLLFAVHPSHFLVVGHYGIDTAEGASAKQLSDLQIPRLAPSLLARAADKRQPILAKLPTSEEDARIVESLGGPSPSKSFAVPLTIDEEVALVLYGDHLPDDLSTGRLDELEIAAQSAVRPDHGGDES